MRVGLATAVLLLAGCGGSDSGSTEKGAAATATPTATASEDASSGRTMSAAKWSQKVEALCEKSRVKATKAGRRLGRESAAAGDSKKEFTAKVLALTSKQLDPWLDKAEALPKPEGREQAASEFIADMRDVGDLIAKTSKAIREDDDATGKRLVKDLQAKTTAVREEAKELDISECNPPSS